MKPTEKAAFVTLISSALAFYRRDASDFALTVWWEACKGFEYEQVAKALTAHAMDPERGQFAPMPADLIRLLEGTRTDRSLIAWGKVLDAIQRVGAYQSVAFDDPAIHATIEDLGGWMKVCRGNTDDLSYLQKRFCDSHKAYSARGDFPYPAKLIGEHEAQNRLNGFEPAPPLLVGDAKKAQLVLTQGGKPKAAISIAQALPDVKRIGGRAA